MNLYLKALINNIAAIVIALAVYIPCAVLSDWLLGSAWPGVALLLLVALAASTYLDAQKAKRGAK